MLLTNARSRPLLKAIRHKLWSAVQNVERPAESGVHIDPAEVPPVDMSTRSRWHREAVASPEMAAFREVLRVDGRSVRESVLDDLATFYETTPEEARRRCLHWEQISVQEWAEAGGDEGDRGRVEFYRTTRSWSYDLMWWAYLQSEGHADPSNVVAVRFLQEWAPGRRHLDFGSGVGVTTQLFAALGWDSTMADLSSTLLDFARFRIERRGGHPTAIDLLDQTLPAGGYDAITAIDTLAHVPDINETARTLHAALGPDGVLVTNLDIREAAPETVWHLHDDAKRAEYDLRRAGFVPLATMGYDMTGYRKVPASGPRFRLFVFTSWLLLVSPPRRWAAAATRPLLRGLYRLRERLRGGRRQDG
ncbi:Methyltransferase type 12 [Pseudonocardia dioxanivorans CB1190]|uniref:Methyltransferase type 12 n=1 Tax=Pseudonocardia dioxanivorans (strain ATCC 55486 / DSM 44775 / JCM 13855 / CB1190) TaxID=675635 RepID=F4CS54_PSEUX|nr:Methyltransferase type 12 [Pseudonocardia dioxanivorans CB1190]